MPLPLRVVYLSLAPFATVVLSEELASTYEVCGGFQCPPVTEALFDCGAEVGLGVGRGVGVTSVNPLEFPLSFDEPPHMPSMFITSSRIRMNRKIRNREIPLRLVGLPPPEDGWEGPDEP